MDSRVAWGAFAMIALATCLPVTSGSDGGTTSLNCGPGTYQVQNQCVADPGSSSGSSSGSTSGYVTITIEPSIQTGMFDCYNGKCSSYAAPCYAFAPNPASVVVNGSFVFLNDSPVSITIVGGTTVPGNPGTPWVTVAAGAVSAPLSFSTAGDYFFGVNACPETKVVNVTGTACYGVINVTVA